jgi:hypothetical protein
MELEAENKRLKARVAEEKKRARHAAYRAANREKVRASQKRYRAAGHGKAKHKASRAVWLKTEAGRAYTKRGRDRHQAKIRAAFTAFIREAKGHPCTDCGGQFPPCAMDFDHVRGKKLFILGRGAGKGLPAVIAEIAKCDLVCSNCHRIRTALRRYGRI